MSREHEVTARGTPVWSVPQWGRRVITGRRVLRTPHLRADLHAGGFPTRVDVRLFSCSSSLCYEPSCSQKLLADFVPSPRSGRLAGEQGTVRSVWICSLHHSGQTACSAISFPCGCRFPNLKSGPVFCSIFPPGREAVWMRLAFA